MPSLKKIVLGLLVLGVSLMAVELGKVPVKATLFGENGGKIDGTVWNSSSLKGKVHILFYVDPDKKDLNKQLSQALKAKNYPREKVNSVAMVNLKATWLPNIVLEALLKSKQKEFPYTLFVKDKEKVLVKKWNLEDDNSDILIFNKEGKLIYKKFGKVSSNEIAKVISLIEKNL